MAFATLDDFALFLDLAEPADPDFFKVLAAGRVVFPEDELAALFALVFEVRAVDEAALPFGSGSAAVAGEDVAAAPLAFKREAATVPFPTFVIEA